MRINPQRQNSGKSDLAELFNEFRPWLTSYARMLSPWYADDAVQEAFAVLAKRSLRPPPVKNQRGYLVGTVQNLVAAEAGRRRLKPEPIGFYNDIYGDPDLAEAFELLPFQQRTCIVLRYGQDQTIAQIADLLALSPSTIKTHLSRALRALRAELGEPSC